MSLIGIIALPCVLMGMVFFCVIRRAYLSKSPARPFLLYPPVCSLIITGGFMAWGYHAVLTSKSSTAAIGLFFVPIYSVAVAVAGVVVSWAVIFLARFVVQRIQGIPLADASIAPLALAIVVLAFTGYTVQGKVARHRLLNAAASETDTASLETILADSISSRDLEVLAKLAENRRMPTADLVRIYDFCKPNVAKSHPPEYPILFSLARNPRTPPDILGALAGCGQSTIRYYVAVNHSTPTKTLQQLSEDKYPLVQKYAERRFRSRRRRKVPE